jgi:hypothetical protein
MAVFRRCAKEELEGCIVVTRAAWPAIEKICGGRKGIRPEGRRYRGLEKKRAEPIVEGAKDSLCAAVLL